VVGSRRRQGKFQHPVTANIVSPGPVNTEMFISGKNKETIERMAAMSFQGRIGEPEDIANLATFVLGPEGRFLQGSLIDMDGGATKTI
jgi:3-oxoacyl-[acyl-carrier protein] reductase